MESSTSSSVLDSTCLTSHVYNLLHEPETYLQCLRLRCEMGTLDTPTRTSCDAKATIITGLQITSHYQELGYVLRFCNLKDIVKAAERLDLNRYMSKVQRKLVTIENSNPHLKKQTNQLENSDMTNNNNKRKHEQDMQAEIVCKYRRIIYNIEKDLDNDINDDNQHFHSCDDDSSSSSSSTAMVCREKAHKDDTVRELIENACISVRFSRLIRKWTKENLPSDYLEYIMLRDDYNNGDVDDSNNHESLKRIWKRLANIIHFSPTDFKVYYFLSDVHGGIIPKSSFVYKMRTFINETKNDSSNTTMAHAEHIAEKFKSLAESFPQLCGSAYLRYYIRTQPQLMKNCEIVNEYNFQLPLISSVSSSPEIAISASSGHNSNIQNGNEKIITKKKRLYNFYLNSSSTSRQQ